MHELNEVGAGKKLTYPTESNLVCLLNVKDKKGQTLTQGTIKTIRSDKGFGFITPDNESQDVFFHRTSVEGERFDDLQEGERVEFTMGRDPRDASRTRAESVRVIE